jgi:bifunctional DNA-binding transcriptional regulator/antitoxin component of YhaV-PrlF toxin-antitoxin module
MVALSVHNGSMKLSETVSAGFTLGPKGRVSLPVAVRRGACIADGAELVAHVDGNGRIVIETRDAIRARVWDAAPASAGLDATADVRAMRTQDRVTSDAASATRSETATDGDAGAALLAHLGLA